MLVDNTLAVIMPFFQREPAILARSMKSVIRQYVPVGWAVDVIIIDDASPVSAKDELRDLEVTAPFRVEIIRQENAGVGAARNRGLEEAAKAASLVAFLDSDDIWPVDHLARAIKAMDEGFDFYFTDNYREGHHESHCRSPYVAETAGFLDSSSQKTGLLEIPKDRMIGLTLREFPSQASTVVYKRNIYSSLKFNTDLKYSGEDVLFFISLVSRATRICFDLDSRVECGGGVNIYFSNLSWSAERFLAIKVDKLVTHRLIAERIALSPCNKKWNDEVLSESRKELAFHMLRILVKYPARALREIKRLARIAPGALAVLPFDMIRTAFGHLRNHNKREHRERQL